MIWRHFSVGMAVLVFAVAAWGQVPSAEELEAQKRGVYFGKTSEEYNAKGFTDPKSVATILWGLKEGDKNQRQNYFHLCRFCRVDQEKVLVALADFMDPAAEVEYRSWATGAASAQFRSFVKTPGEKKPEELATYERVIAAMEKRGVPKEWKREYAEFLLKTGLERGRFVDLFIEVAGDQRSSSDVMIALESILVGAPSPAQQKVIAAIRTQKPRMSAMLATMWGNRYVTFDVKTPPGQIMGQLLKDGNSEERRSYISIFYSEDISRVTTLMEGLAAAATDRDAEVAAMALNKLKSIEGAGGKYAALIKRSEEQVKAKELWDTRQALANPRTQRDTMQRILSGQAALPRETVMGMFASSDQEEYRFAWEVAFQNSEWFREPDNEGLWLEAAKAEDKIVVHRAWRFAERNTFVVEGAEKEKFLASAVYSEDPEVQSSARKIWLRVHPGGLPTPPGYGSVFILSLMPMVLVVGSGVFLAWRMIKAPLKRIARENPMNGAGLMMMITCVVIICWQTLALAALVLIGAHLEWWMTMPLFLMVFGIILICVEIMMMSRRAKGGLTPDFVGLAVLVGLTEILLACDLIARFTNTKAMGAMAAIHVVIEVSVILGLGVGVIWMWAVRGSVPPSEIGKPGSRPVPLPGTRASAAPGGGQGNVDALTALAGFSSPAPSANRPQGKKAPPPPPR